MALDSVRAVGLECPSEGGTQTAKDLTEIDPREDALTAAGFFVNGPTVSAVDKTVLVDRAASGNLRFTDQKTTSLLSDLMTISNGSSRNHAQIRDVQHFLGNEGPGDGFASGCVMARSFSGPLLTNETWYTSSAMSVKLISKTFAYASNSPVPSTITWVVYNSSGVAIRTVVDTFSYNGPICTQVTRTWS